MTVVWNSGGLRIKDSVRMEEGKNLSEVVGMERQEQAEKHMKI